MTRRENQTSIWLWVLDTFGRPKPLRSMERLLEETRELRKVYNREVDLPPDISGNDTGIAELMEECADVVICAYAFAAAAGKDLDAEVDRKMAINRARKWERCGDGTGYHVKPKAGGS